MKSAVRQRSSHWLSRGFSLVLALITACLCVGIGSSLAEAKPEANTSTPTIYTDQKVIKIQDQPFYPELEIWRQRWDEGNFYGEITGVSAKETVLKFYSAMSIAGELTREVAAQASTDPGLGWSKEAQEKINDAELLFTTASQAINAYYIPESARDDAQEEAALKLKEVLDYIFNNSKSPINIPGERKKAMKEYQNPPYLSRQTSAKNPQIIHFITSRATHLKQSMTSTVKYSKSESPHQHQPTTLIELRGHIPTTPTRQAS